MSENTLKPISLAAKRMWEKQNLADLLFWADLPLTKKIQMLEEMEEVAKAFHGGKLPVPPAERAASQNRTHLGGRDLA